MFITAFVPVTSVAGSPWQGDGPPAFWPVFPVAWLLILVTAAVVGFLLVRRNRADVPRRAGEARLAERFAIGEIDAEEYRTRLDVLRNRRGRIGGGSGGEH